MSRQQAGLRAPTIYGAEDGSDYIVETIGCGAVFFDYDNDGWLDIFLPCGSRFNDAPKDATNRLYKNNRDGTFTDVTEKAGLLRSGWASGVTVGDYNNDGFEDLFLTYWGQNVLYRNNGDGTFTDVTKEAGLLNEKTRWGSGCTFVDYDRDGRLDLFVANYLQFDPKTTPRKGQDTACNWKGVAVNCGPRGLLPETHLLYHNNGDGTFTDVSVKSGIAKAKGSYGLTAVAADFDNDGWPDIFVACDSTPSLLFRNNHDGTFTEDGMSRGVALNDDGAGAGRHGRRRRRFQPGRPPRYPHHPLRRRHQHALHQRRQGQLPRRDPARRPGRGDPLRQLGLRHARPRQRWLPRPLRRHRQRLSRRWSGPSPNWPTGPRACSSATWATASSRS